MSLEHNDIDRLVSTYREDFSPDVEAGLRRLHERINPVRQLRPRSRQRIYYAVAAAAALFIAVATFLLTRDGLTHLRNDTDAIAEFTLPDGSRLMLQNGSHVSYDAEAFNLADRSVNLDGQAYFEVIPDPALPFLVTNSHGTLRVTGTAFNLRAGNDLLEVEVSEGSVLLEREDDTVEVAAMEYGMVRKGRPIIHRPAPNLNHHAWRTGQLKFDHTPISEVLAYFKDNWNIECSWAEDVPCNYAVSGSYRGGDAGAVLADIAKLGGLTLRALDSNGTRFELSGNCKQ